MKRIEKTLRRNLPGQKGGSFFDAKFTQENERNEIAQEASISDRALSQKLSESSEL